MGYSGLTTLEIQCKSGNKQALLIIRKNSKAIKYNVHFFHYLKDTNLIPSKLFASVYLGVHCIRTTASLDPKCQPAGQHSVWTGKKRKLVPAGAGSLCPAARS